MARLPIPGADDGTWGDILNDYLGQSLNADGSLKSTAVPDGSVTPEKLSQAYIPSSEKGALDGVATLDTNGKVPISQLPAPGITIQDDNGTALNNVTQLDFQGAGVSAASGVGEVVVTIPGTDTETIQDAVAGFIQAGSGITVEHDDTANALTIAASGAQGTFRGDWAAANESIYETFDFGGGTLPPGFTSGSGYAIAAYQELAGGSVVPSPDYMATFSDSGTANIGLDLSASHPATRVKFWMTERLSNSGWDAAQFLVNGAIVLDKYTPSPGTPWTQYTFDITAGATLLWRRTNNSGGMGSDLMHVARIELIEMVGNVYDGGEFVVHNGKLWRCDYDGTITEPGVSGWTEVPFSADGTSYVPSGSLTSTTVQGAIDELASGGSSSVVYKGTWNSTASYPENSLVLLNGYAYVATVDHGANESPAPVMTNSGTVGAEYGIGTSDYGYRRIATGFRVTRNAYVKRISVRAWGPEGLSAGDTIGIAEDFGTGTNPTYLGVGTTGPGTAGTWVEVEFGSAVELLTGVTYRAVWVGNTAASDIQLHYDQQARSGIVANPTYTSIHGNGAAWDATTGQRIWMRLYEEVAPTGWDQVAGHPHPYATETALAAVDNRIDTLTLDDLAEVDLVTTPPTDGQVLMYDGGTSLWKPGSAATTDGTIVATRYGQYTSTSGTASPGTTVTIGTASTVIVGANQIVMVFGHTEIYGSSTGAAGNVALFRDTTNLGSNYFHNQTSTYRFMVPAYYVDTPGPGTYTYTLKISPDVSSAAVSYGYSRIHVAVIEVAGSGGGSGSTTLDGLTDVDTSTIPPNSGEALIYSTAANKWLPGTVTSSQAAGLGANEYVLRPYEKRGSGLSNSWFNAASGSFVAGGGYGGGFLFMGAPATVDFYVWIGPGTYTLEVVGDSDSSRGTQTWAIETAPGSGTFTTLVDNFNYYQASGYTADIVKTQANIVISGGGFGRRKLRHTCSANSGIQQVALVWTA